MRDPGGIPQLLSWAHLEQIECDVCRGVALRQHLSGVQLWLCVMLRQLRMLPRLLQPKKVLPSLLCPGADPSVLQWQLLQFDGARVQGLGGALQLGWWRALDQLYKQ